MSIKYRGETFSGYNKPKRTPGGPKKFAVLAKSGDQTKFARSGGIKGTSNKLSANYWSRKAWSC
jgi:hypothetical protein